MTPDSQRIAIAEACGWRGQPVEQAWNHKKGFPKYWRSMPIFQDETFDFFSTSRIARVLLNPENKLVFRKVYCGILNNRDSYSMVPVVEYFDNADQYKPWPIIAQSLVPFVDHLPDYLADLNAMHEAELMLVPSNEYRLSAYMFELTKLTIPAGRVRRGDISEYIFHATAAQRAEAFLRTLGKWEDTHSSVRETYKL